MQGSGATRIDTVFNNRCSSHLVESALYVWEEAEGRAAKQKTVAGAVSKAMKGLVGGVAEGTVAEREQWTADLIPRSQVAGTPCTTPDEERDARECAWGAGDVRLAKAEMRQANRGAGGALLKYTTERIFKLSDQPSHIYEVFFLAGWAARIGATVGNRTPSLSYLAGIHRKICCICQVYRGV